MFWVCAAISALFAGVTGEPAGLAAGPVAWILAEVFL